MPEGSSSLAPVTSPGPSFFQFCNRLDKMDFFLITGVRIKYSNAVLLYDVLVVGYCVLSL